MVPVGVCALMMMMASGVSSAIVSSEIQEEDSTPPGTSNYQATPFLITRDNYNDVNVHIMLTPSQIGISTLQISVLL